MDCDNTTNSECLLRHKRQDDTEKMISQMYEIICGGLHPENSLSTKVDEMYKENRAVKNFVKGCLISLVMLIFWCGYQFAVLQHCVNRIEKIEVQIESIGR